MASAVATLSRCAVSRPPWAFVTVTCFQFSCRKRPWSRKLQPTPVLLPGEFQEPSGLLLFVGSQRLRHDWAHTDKHIHTFFHILFSILLCHHPFWILNTVPCAMQWDLVVYSFSTKSFVPAHHKLPSHPSATCLPLGKHKLVSMSVRVTIVTKSTNITRREERALLHCWWECKFQQPLWETVPKGALPYTILQSCSRAYVQRRVKSTMTQAPTLTFLKEAFRVSHTANNCLINWIETEGG